MGSCSETATHPCHQRLLCPSVPLRAAAHPAACHRASFPDTHPRYRRYTSASDGGNSRMLKLHMTDGEGLGFILETLQ